MTDLTGSFDWKGTWSKNDTSVWNVETKKKLHYDQIYGNEQNIAHLLMPLEDLQELSNTIVFHLGSNLNSN